MQECGILYALFLLGRVSEWSMVQPWKGCVGASPPGVRIPPPPPVSDASVCAGNIILSGSSASSPMMCAELSRIRKRPKLAVISRLAASGFGFEGETLKNVPKDYPKDHPLGEYLKRKEFILVKHVDEDYFDCEDWVQRVNDDFKVLKPIHDFLDYVYDE